MLSFLILRCTQLQSEIHLSIIHKKSWKLRQSENLPVAVASVGLPGGGAALLAAPSAAAATAGVFVRTPAVAYVGAEAVQD